MTAQAPRSRDSPAHEHRPGRSRASARCLLINRNSPVRGVMSRYGQRGCRRVVLHGPLRLELAVCQGDQQRAGQPRSPDAALVPRGRGALPADADRAARRRAGHQRERRAAVGGAGRPVPVPVEGCHEHRRLGLRPPEDYRARPPRRRGLRRSGGQGTGVPHARFIDLSGVSAAPDSDVPFGFALEILAGLTELIGWRRLGWLLGVAASVAVRRRRRRSRHPETWLESGREDAESSPLTRLRRSRLAAWTLRVSSLTGRRGRQGSGRGRLPSEGPAWGLPCA
jgi:hypothetical protein